ncbi:MAG TPA: mannosyltransferase family protein [Chloroflexia bacterium]|nr:mannosyltransferase family protein [Chloroflexia bacterium]
MENLDPTAGAPPQNTATVAPPRTGWWDRVACVRPLLLLWLCWALLLGGYQIYARARFAPQRPDYALTWTANETRAGSQNDKPYLLEPFLNDHVSWDSEYYLSIALGGYDDPQMRAIPATFSWDHPQIALKQAQPSWISTNYAFFPFYPLLMHVAAWPLAPLGLNALATATLAGVLVSLLGTLGAMLALYDLARDSLGAAGGRRAAWYLLIFPAGMFLAQVYTEGLFLGLSFGALALARREKWIWAAVLAAGATWTRASGILLLLPLAGYWWQQGNLTRLWAQRSAAALGKLLLVGSPVLAYLLWNALYGGPFQIVESHYFSRGLLLISQSQQAWGAAWSALFGTNRQAQAYYLVEFAAIGFSLVACALLWTRDRLLVLYSVALILFALTSGVAQGMHRYVMAAPVLFLLPARWGRNDTFDRAWTFGNVLLLGVFAVMFSADLWAG